MLLGIGFFFFEGKNFSCGKHCKILRIYLKATDLYTSNGQIVWDGNYISIKLFYIFSIYLYMHKFFFKDSKDHIERLNNLPNMMARGILK